MLVLSRTKGQRVRCQCKCGEVHEVFVVKVRGDKVRLGFDGPRDVEFTRGELIDKEDGQDGD